MKIDLEINSTFSRNFIKHFEKELDKYPIEKRLRFCVQGNQLNDAAKKCYYVKGNTMISTPAYDYLCRFMQDKEFARVYTNSNHKVFTGRRIQSQIKNRLCNLNIFKLSETERIDAYALFFKYISVAEFAVNTGFDYEDYREFFISLIYNKRSLESYL